MSDSLILNDGTRSIELVPADPTGYGFHLLADYDFGDPQSITNAIRSVLLDGESVVGRQASNRTFTLPIQIKSPNRLYLTAADDTLRTLVDQPAFTLTWAAAGGFTTVWDCYRGQAQGGWDQFEEGNATRELTLTFQARPYGRSATPSALSLTALRTTTRSRTWTVNSPQGSARAPLYARLDAHNSDGTITSARGGCLLHRSPDASPSQLVAQLSAKSAGEQHVNILNSRLRPGRIHDGTFALIMDMQTGATSGTGTVTVTVTQTAVATGLASDITGDPVVLTLDYTDGIVNSYHCVGFLTLPLIDYAGSFTSRLTFSVTDTNSAAVWGDVILCDVAGETLIVPQSTELYGSLEVDEPDPDQVAGAVYLKSVYGGFFFAPTQLIRSGGQLLLDPRGGSYLGHFSVGPTDLVLTGTYSARWLGESSA